MASECRYWKWRVSPHKCPAHAQQLNFLYTNSDHPFFVGLQAHPEFSTRPLNPSPPFLGLVAAACGSDVLEQQMRANEQSYVSPHPQAAKVIPAREAASKRGEGKPQEVKGIVVDGDK